MTLRQLKTELRTVIAPYKPRAHRTLAQYKTDPVSYAREVLNVKFLTPDQQRLLMAAAMPRARVLGPSANETGKSFVSAILCSWHYDCFYPSLTITTAPARAQVEDILFRELRRLRRGDPDFSPKAARLQSDNDRICVGYTTANAHSFQGRHDADVMVIFDEAEGIDKEFWEAAESFADRWVCMYNPTTGKSEASRQERRDNFWTKITISAFTHPNIAAELAGYDRPVPQAVSLAKLKDRLKSWAKPLHIDEPRKDNDIELDGTWWRLGPVAEARLLGRRPSNSINTVFSESVWNRVRKTQIKERDMLPCIGCDVARFGDDMTTIHIRRGGVSLLHESHNGWNTVDTTRRLRFLADKFAPAQMSLVPILVDDVGVGGGVVDQLTGMNVFPISSQTRSDFPDDYPDIRSQLHFQFEELCSEGLVDLSRIETHDIEEQLNAVCYELTAKGQRIVWPKKKVKEQLGRSPDDADAVLLAYYQFTNDFEIH